MASSAQHDVFSTVQVDMTKFTRLEMLLRFTDLVEDAEEEVGR
jgi:hypothetical protein